MALLILDDLLQPLERSLSVKILNYRIVEDGKYVLYTIQVSLETYTWTMEKRYSDFDAFDQKKYPDRKKSFLPPKKVVGNLDPEFLQERKVELEKYIKTLLELEVWQQKKNRANSLSLLVARFFDFHQYEVHSIVDDLSVRLGRVGELWLNASEQSPKYFEFTPIELYAVTERLKLAEPTAPDPYMVADIGNTVDFLHRVRNLKVRGAKGYVRSSNVVWNSLDFSLHCCKNLLALWLTDCDVTRITGLANAQQTLRRLVVHYSMKRLQDLLLEGETDKPVSEFDHWQCVEEADFSFNDLTEIDETVRLLGPCAELNLSHNLLTDVGVFLQHLSNLTALDLSHNKIANVDGWHRKMGNLKWLRIAGNTITDLNGLGKLYSLEFLDASENCLETIESVRSVGKLPCLEELVLTGNPVRKQVEYRTKVLESFGERALEVLLDGKKVDDREKDTIAVRLALRRAKDEKEAQERDRREKVENDIRYLSGDSEVESVCDGITNTL